ncbi:MAG: histone [Gammaproteobacteria bacterium]|nr:histone [Gammaproteobacteria bacterium]
MKAKIEKLTLALAEVKAAISGLKEEKRALKTAFKEELKVAKSGQKPVAKNSVAKKKAVKKAATKKVVGVKKTKSPRPKKAAPLAKKIEEPAVESVISTDDIFPLGE